MGFQVAMIIDCLQRLPRCLEIGSMLLLGHLSLFVFAKSHVMPFIVQSHVCLLVIHITMMYVFAGLTSQAATERGGSLYSCSFTMPGWSPDCNTMNEGPVQIKSPATI